VALVQTSGRSLNQVAAELGVSHWNLRDWREIYGARSTPASSPNNSSGCARNSAKSRAEGRPKKSVGHPLHTVRHRFAQMKRLEVNHPVTALAAAFGVSRSGLLSLVRGPGWTAQAGGCPAQIEIKTLHEQSRGTYGRPRLVAPCASGPSPSVGEGWRGCGASSACGPSARVAGDRRQPKAATNSCAGPTGCASWRPRRRGPESPGSVT